MDTVQQTIEEQRTQAHRKAAETFRRSPDWVTFYREILGVDGVINCLFSPFDKRCEFEKSEEYAKIQQMLARLREKSRGQKQPDEPTRVITVRLPQSLHEALRHEAHNHKTSMNKLCISKLLQVIEDDLVPSDFHRHDGDGSGNSQPRANQFSQPQQAAAESFRTEPTPPPASSFHRPEPTPPQPHFRVPPQSPGRSTF